MKKIFRGGTCAARPIGANYPLNVESARTVGPSENAWPKNPLEAVTAKTVDENSR